VLPLGSEHVVVVSPPELPELPELPPEPPLPMHAVGPVGFGIASHPGGGTGVPPEHVSNATTWVWHIELSS
jgi:hypothetical protein